MLDPVNGQLILGKWQTLLELTSNRALSKFILIEINLMRMPLEERNTSIKTRIEKRKATAARKDAELKPVSSLKSWRYRNNKLLKSWRYGNKLLVI